MITIHHLYTSRSERIVWLMADLGLPCEIERFKREESSAAPAAM